MKYEMLYLIDSSIAEDAREALIAKFEGLVASLGGAVGDGFDAGMLLLELHQARVQLFFGDFHMFQRAFQAAILKFHIVLP